MTHKTINKNVLSENLSPDRAECGFTILEMILSICILIPVMAGALQLFSFGVQQQSSEQSSVEANQDASAGFNLMEMEIVEAGCNTRHFTTTSTDTITGDPYYPYTYAIASTSGLQNGDVVELYSSATGATELVQLSSVTNGYITGIFQKDFPSGSVVRLFSLPYATGILFPGTPTANSTTSVTELKFYGDIYGDGSMYYAEYKYDSANKQITRSVTSLSETSKKPHVPLITNVKSAQFLLHTDAMKIVTAVTLSVTVENEWKTNSKLQEINLSSKLVIPSMETVSALALENLQFGPVNPLPSTPTRIALLNAVEML
jgi:type II secretory pathway pseudopilin PulG